ncbi:hypothetical protein [Nonomuraea sp. NPDC005650]|uniref:hypothetical protein n=1 Tax=Nonomuraea sp. NPDC005650 TaxID=3157045 RepID=UPI0033AFB9BB
MSDLPSFPNDSHAELLLDIYLEAAHRPDDPYAVLRAIRQRQEATANEQRILEHLHDLEVARLHELRSATGERLLHMKNIAAQLGVSIGQVSKIKKRASADELAHAIADETHRLHLVAKDPNVTAKTRLKAQVRAVMLGKALQRLTSHIAGAAAALGALWAGTRIAAALKGSMGAGTIAAGGAPVAASGLAAGVTATGGGLTTLVSSAPALVSASVLAVGTYAVGAPVVKMVAPPPNPVVINVADDGQRPLHVPDQFASSDDDQQPQHAIATPPPAETVATDPEQDPEISPSEATPTGTSAPATAQPIHSVTPTPTSSPITAAAPTPRHTKTSTASSTPPATGAPATPTTGASSSPTPTTVQAPQTTPTPAEPPNSTPTPAVTPTPEETGSDQPTSTPTPTPSSSPTDEPTREGEATAPPSEQEPDRRDPAAPEPPLSSANPAPAQGEPLGLAEVAVVPVTAIVPAPDLALAGRD